MLEARYLPLLPAILEYAQRHEFPTTKRSQNPCILAAIMMVHLFTLHSQARWDFVLKTLLAWVVLTAMAWIPVGLIPGTALPYAWAGVVMIGLWMGMRVGIAALLLHQLGFTLYQCSLHPLSFDTTSWVLSLGLGVKITEWITVLLMGLLSTWKEITKPWWTYLVATLGLTLLHVGGGLWMHAQNITLGVQWLKNHYSAIFILAALILMLTQLLRRLFTGREQFYSH